MADSAKVLPKPAGLPEGFTCHQFRHAFATRLLAAGLPPTDVARWLGHAGLSCLMVYAHVMPDTLARARLALADIA